MTTKLTEQDVRLRLSELVTQLYKKVPSGAGGERRRSSFQKRTIGRYSVRDPRWAVERGCGRDD